ncbi:MMPL family transporter, partial [Myxococcota bacterium]|nr:MMPL family transporter [Myxococcota bacterium]
MNRAISRFTGWVIIRHPGAIALLMLVAIAFSAWRVSYLHINYNQLDLIPQELPAVQSTREMIDLLGGVGYLLFAMESDDLDHMKEVADDLGARFRKIPGVHKVSFKQDVSFVQQKIALFAEPEDLKEGYKRVRRKIRSIIAKNNPFHIQLTEAKEVELNLDDLVDKYRRLSKRAIDDDYNVDPKKEMIMMVIKPSGAASDLAFTRKLLENFNLAIAEFNADNKLKAKVIEYYGDESRPEGATVTFGYAGGYKSTLDDSDTIREALAPTSLVAFFGIFFYLLFFLRRPFQILLLMSVLVASVLMTFAFAELTIGELNTITALLGAILMGIGIDYGIHFLYRLREEYSHDQNLERAIQDAVEHSGSASLASALTTTAALYILSMADFRGFSDFGIIMGTGVLITAAMMYTAIPVVYLLIDRIAPSFKNHLLMKAAKESDDELKNKPFPWARPILLGTVALTVVLAFFATQVTFDYNTRSLMSADRPSLVLQDEINERYQISADPIAVFTPTIEEARAIYDQLVPLKEDSTIDFVVSLYSLVPDPEKQKANR